MPEDCDDGPQSGSYEACAADCGGPEAFCGDGVANGPEVCDDANAAVEDACLPDCQPSNCNACTGRGPTKPTGRRQSGSTLYWASWVILP